MRADRFGLVATGLLTVVLAGATIMVLANGAQGEKTSTAPDGRLLFQTRGCIGCHTLDSAPGGSIGPNLTGLAEVAGSRVQGLSPSAYVRQSITEPDAFTVSGYPAGVMPTFSLTDAEVDDLVVFLLGSD